MKSVTHSVRRTRRPPGLKARGLRFEEVEPRLAMSGLIPAIDAGMLAAAGAATRDAAPAAVAPALPADTGAMGQLPPQRLSLSGGSLDPQLVDFWMTQRPNQEPTPGTDLDGWLSSGGGLDFGGRLNDPNGFGLPFGGPTGRNPLNGPSPFGSFGSPFLSPADFQGFSDLGLGNRSPTGVGQMPLFDPNLGGGTAFNGGTEPAQTTPLIEVESIEPAETARPITYVPIPNFMSYAAGKAMIESHLRNGAESGTYIYTGDDRFTWVEATYVLSSGSLTGEIKILECFNSVTGRTSQWILGGDSTGSGNYAGPEGLGARPANPSEAFQSVWFVYATLRVEAPTHDDTRIDILINPRSMTDGSFGSSVQFVGIGGQTAAFGGGAAVGPGAVNTLPFVGNKDPNPLNPGGPSATSGLSSALVSALSVRDPRPLG